MSEMELREHFERNYAKVAGHQRDHGFFVRVNPEGDYVNPGVRFAWQTLLAVSKYFEAPPAPAASPALTSPMFYPRDKNTGMNDDQATSLDIFEREYQRSFGASATLFVRNRVVGEEVYHSSYAVHAYRGWLAALAYRPQSEPPPPAKKSPEAIFTGLLRPFIEEWLEDAGEAESAHRMTRRAERIMRSLLRLIDLATGGTHGN